MSDLTKGIAAIEKAGAAAIGAEPGSEPVAEQAAIDAGNVALMVAAPGAAKLFTPLIDAGARLVFGLFRRRARPGTPTPTPGSAT